MCKARPSHTDNYVPQCVKGKKVLKWDKIFKKLNASLAVIGTYIFKSKDVPSQENRTLSSSQVLLSDGVSVVPGQRNHNSIIQ